MQGVSRTLFEEVKFDATGVNSLDWASYPVLRFQDVPEVQIQLINRPELSLGVKSVWNRQTFLRQPSQRRLRCDWGSPSGNPFTPERVLNALKKVKLGRRSGCVIKLSLPENLSLAGSPVCQRFQQDTMLRLIIKMR